MLLAQAPAVHDTRLFFVLNIVVLVGVVVFAMGVVAIVVRRSYRRQVEEAKLAAIGTATARILHQIKNPLQTIVLHADILDDERIVSDPVGRREVCEAIIGESQRLVAMLDELSVYASGSNRPLSRQPIPLHEVVRQVVGNEARESLETGIQVDGTGITDAVVEADPYYLRQVFDNLVRNAREALAGETDPRIAVSLRTGGGNAAVRIADNGPGIPPDWVEKIFQPFVSTKGTGMGLGLAICREIVEGHGGRLEVESQLGRGTVFTVLLPLCSDDARSADTQNRGTG